jgi:HEAT repeat protein
MKMKRWCPITAGWLIMGMVLAAMPVPAETVESILEADGLKTAYNPVLLDYLLDEGVDDLPDDQRKEAIDQLVTALQEDIEITPAEQKAAAMAAAAAGLAQLFGGRDVGDLGAAAGDATYDIWRGWVDSAITLQRAGYADQANAFFEKCIEIYPYGDLKGRCAIALAVGKPDETVSRLMALTEQPDPDTINAALRLLGELAGSEGFPEETRALVVSRIIDFTGGMKKASYGEAACYGLVEAADPGAVPKLQDLSKGIMNANFHRCARKGLLLTYDDQSVVPLLEKTLKAGKFSTTEPWDSFFSATVLMEAGKESGFTWASEQFARKEKKGMKKMMATEEEVDFKPALVSALVRIGGDQSQQVLSQAMGSVEKGSWIETWIAIGLLELGDDTYIDLVRQALGKPEWEFTTVRIATALAEHGDYSGIPALKTLYGRAAQGIEPETGKAALAFLAGEGGEFLSDRDAREARLMRLRRQIADALASIDHAGSGPVLAEMLDDPEPSVRTATARALARMTDPSALPGLAKAMTVEYGNIGESSRNPTVRAHVARQAANNFAGESGTADVLGAAVASEYTSVKFLGLCASQ